MINQKDLSKNMSRDIDEMENMLNDYLQFAKTQSQEKTIKIELKQLFNEILSSLNNKNIKIVSIPEIFLNGRPFGFKKIF